MVTCKAAMATSEQRKFIGKIAVDAPSIKKRLIITRICLFYFSFYCFFLGLSTFNLEKRIVSCAIWHGIGVISFILGLFIKRYLNARLKGKINSLLKNVLQNNNLCKYTFSENHVKMVGTYNEITYDWNLFSIYAESDFYISLISLDDCVLVVDKSSVPNERTTEFYDLLKRKSQDIFQ